VRRGLTLFIALFCLAGALLALPASAQEKEAPPRREVRFDWDTPGRKLLLDVSFRDAIDSDILRKLTRGLPTTIVFTATLYRAGTRQALSTTAQSCKITWLVWEELYLIEIARPTGSKGPAGATSTAAGVLRRCAEATKLVAAAPAQIPVGAALYLEAKVQVNPVSAELLQRIKRWVSRPSGTATAAPGDALFSTFTGLFLQRIGNAERELNFTTKSAVPSGTRPKKP
jgi:hypothetical protein